MTTAARLAARLALSADPRQRWRQASIVVSACLAAFVLAMGTAVVAASHEVEAVLSARAPLPPVSDVSESALTMTPRGFTIGDREVVLRWVEPEPGHERDPAVVPPGLARLPGPGEAVLSPGLLRLGIGPESLGFGASSAGTGPDGSIGPEGVGTQDELIAWVRPEPGRSLGGDGMAVVRFPSQSEASILENHDDVLAHAPMPEPREALVVVLVFFAIPSLLMLGLAARARSELRTQRSEFLLRLGISRLMVRSVLFLEGLLLAGLGATAGVLAYGLVGPLLTTVPLTGTVFLAGALGATPGAMLAAGSAVAILVAVVCSSGRLELSLRQRPRRIVSPWRTVPVVLGIVSMAGSAWLGVDGAPFFVGGVIVVAAGLPFASPALAQVAGRRWRRRSDPAVWMAAARVVHDPQRSSRVAALLGLSVFLGATSVSIYVGPMGGLPQGTNSASSGSAAYAATWLDSQDDDVEHLAREMHRIDPSAVVLPLGRGPDDETGGAQVVGLDDCSVLRPVADVLGADPCDSSGELAEAARATFRESLSLEIVESAKLTGPDGPGGTAAVDGALVLADHSVSGVDVYRAGAGLPGFNPNDLRSSVMMWGPVAGWIAAGWAISTVVIGWAILRELIEHSRAVHRDVGRLVLVGLDPGEAAQVGRWTLLIPVVATVPVSFVCGLLASFFGIGPEITSYTPAWITLYTVVALAMTGIAAAAGAVMEPSRRGR
jgi:hypothetical protein